MTDRPWGLTLGAIALRRHTGQLTVDSDGKRYCIAFDDGAIVAASSPVAADAIARIALTNHFITSTQVGDIARRLALAPDRDEVEVLADAIRFTPEQVVKLRHRLVAQRAARTFSIERGEFVLDDRIALPVFPGVTVDHRQVIYLGVRTNLAEQRLVDDLRQLGSYFVLKPEVVDELPRYGFEPAAHPVLEALKLGTSLPELEAAHRELDPRFAQAIIYALVSCTACVIPPRTATPPAARAQTPRNLTPRNVTPRHVTSRTTSRALHPTGDAGERETRRHPAPPGSAPREPSPPSTPPALAGGRSPTPSPSGGRSPTPPPSGGRTTTSPFASRANTRSSTSYSGSGAADSGTNTPAATRARTGSDTQRNPVFPDLPSTPTSPPPPRAPTTPPAPRRTPAPSAIQTPPPRAAPRSSAPPPAARTETDEGGKFTDTPTPSPLPGSAKDPGAASFGEPQPVRSAAATTPPGPRPAVSRALTP
ncbi:MAG TPA: DUF4388 domain-containing protein, partial [Kofleriaceae bacterium]|nr:DUF4388 domain-containing protein [Kofleriaceae bacterium]